MTSETNQVVVEMVFGDNGVEDSRHQEVPFKFHRKGSVVVHTCNGRIDKERGLLAVCGLSLRIPHNDCSGLPSHEHRECKRCSR